MQRRREHVLAPEVVEAPAAARDRLGADRPRGLLNRDRDLGVGEGRVLVHRSQVARDDFGDRHGQSL